MQQSIFFMKNIYKVILSLQLLSYPFLGQAKNSIAYSLNKYQDSKDIKNCLVIIVGCADYKKEGNLPKIRKDIAMLEELFEKQYGYTVLSSWRESKKSKKKLCQLSVKEFIQLIRRIDDDALQEVAQEWIDEVAIKISLLEEVIESLGQLIEKSQKELAALKKIAQKKFFKRVKSIQSLERLIKKSQAEFLAKKNERALLNYVIAEYKNQLQEVPGKDFFTDEVKKSFDGVLFIFIGDGYEDTISLYDGEVYIKTLINFLGRAFEKKPKIMMLFLSAHNQIGAAQGKVAPNSMGKNEINLSQDNLDNFYIIRSSTSDYNAHMTKHGSVTILNLRALLLENMFVTASEKVDLFKIKRLLKYLLKNQTIHLDDPKENIKTEKAETVSVSMDTMVERLYFYPKNKVISSFRKEFDNNIVKIVIFTFLMSFWKLILASSIVETRENNFFTHKNYLSIVIQQFITNALLTLLPTLWYQFADKYSLVQGYYYFGRISFPFFAGFPSLIYLILNLYAYSAIFKKFEDQANFNNNDFEKVLEKWKDKVEYTILFVPAIFVLMLYFVLWLFVPATKINSTPSSFEEKEKREEHPDGIA